MESAVGQPEAVASVPAEVAPAAGTVEAAPATWDERLGKTRGAFSSLRALRRQSDLDTTGLVQVKETLLGADVGVETTDVVLAALRERLGRRASGTAPARRAAHRAARAAGPTATGSCT